MRRIVFLRSAERDIETIGEFLGAETPGRAHRAIEMLRRRSRILADFPDIGVAVSGGLRQMVFKDRWNTFVVRYRVTDDAILITRIWHGLQNRPPR
jgi:plasmid stabilization system protein ParE